MLQRVRDLRVQISNGTLSADDQAAIGAEAKQLATEIRTIQDTTTFNGNYLLKADVNGSAGGATATIDFQVGANDSETIRVTTANIITGTGGALVNALADSTDAADAGADLAAISLANIDNAIKEISTVRADFGAVQNRLEHRLNNLATYQENLVASESRIRDVDMAAEMTKFTKLNILQQAGTSMLAQANQAPQGVLSLLR
jgi:flagellin